MAKNPSKTVPNPTVVDPQPSTDPTFMAAYEKWRPVVGKLAPDQVLRCRADVQAAFFNFQRGLDAIRPHEERLRKEVPGISFDGVLEGLALGQAMLFAAGRVAPEPPADQHEIAEKLWRLRELRLPMLDSIETLAALKLLPAKRVAQIRAGVGNYDAARDGVDLHGLMTEFAPQIAGKHPFTQADIDEIGELGSWLLARLPPPGNAQARSSASSDAEDVRNRFWTVFQERATQLRKLGYYLWGEEFNDHTPPLLSKRHGRKPAVEKAQEAGAPAPATPVATQLGK